MYLLFRAYLLLNRILGLNNLGYKSKNTKKHAFSRHNKPALVYCLLLNFAYLVLIPYSAIKDILDFYMIPQKNILIVVIYVSSFAKALSVLTSIINAWSQRVKFCHLLNRYARIFRELHTQIFLANTPAIRNKAKRLLLIKAVALCCLLTLDYKSLYDELKESPTFSYALVVLYNGMLQTLYVFVDCNIFMVLLMSNTLLSIYVQQLRSLRRDVGLLHELEHKPRANRQASKLTHAAWRTRLCFELRVLMLRQHRAQNLIQSLLQIVQWQLVISLVNSLSTLIFLLFAVIFYVQDLKNLQIEGLVLLVVMTAANVWNVQLLFDLCERILQHFRDMRHLLERMLMQCDGGAGGGAKTLLQRSIELFLLQLQQDSMQLNVCRLFNMNRHTGNQMNIAAIGYLISVSQTALQQM